ncbi:hypothetical protein LDENG_00098570 [Lucifuga dentata]|nr:hypothetical protein LDENG_00098570 [Lucifuga dentata]
MHNEERVCGDSSSCQQDEKQGDGRAERSQSVCPSYRLQLEDCLTAEQVPTPELIQGYVKKQIQDAADQGVMFVGFVQEPYGAPCTRIREPDTPSLSLHSSPSSVLGSLDSCSPSNPSSPRNYGEPGVHHDTVDKEGNEGLGASYEAPDEENDPCKSNGNHSGTRVEGSREGAVSPISEGDLEHSEELTEEGSLTHNNNKAGGTETKERPRYRLRRGNGAELLALYNHPTVREGHVKYYTVKVPLRVQNCDEGVKGVEANWLDHMTQHFNNGASLVDGYFHLGNANDLLPKSVESVFIFQEATEGDQNSATPTYDAIVVEQWTIIDGLQVKADYVPLLQSLATFGWRLTCVLPTPVIKTNSDGSLSTKQIVFLQRPILGRKKRESKKLIFKARNKSNKNCIKDAAKSKKKKKKDTEDPKILDDKEKVAKEEANDRDESGDKPEVGAANESEAPKERDAKKEEDRKTDDGIEIGIETVEKKDGGAETKETVGEGGEEKITREQDGAKYNAEALENGENLEATETVVTVEPESETKEGEDEEGAEVEAVVENGLDTDEEKEENGENTTKPETEDPAGMEVVTKEIVALNGQSEP